MKIKNFVLGHKKIFIPLGIIIAVLAGMSIFGKGKDDHNTLSKAETTLIAKNDYSNTITESGKVVSEDSVDIFSEKSLPVSQIDIKVGDKVVSGQVIAKLDDSSIRQQIATKEALIASTNRSTNVQVKGASNKLNEAIKNKNDGTNAQVVSANAAVLQAYDQWQAAEKVYSDYIRSLEQGYNEAFVAKKAADTNLRNSLDTQNLTYNQTIQKLEELRSQTYNARVGYNEKSAQLESLKALDEDLTRQVNQLTMMVEDKSSELQLNSTGNSNSTTLNSQQLAQMQEKANQIQNEIRQYKQQINDITIQATRLKTQIAEVEAEKSKYKTELETNDTSRLALEKEIAQQAQNLENTKNSINSQGVQDQLSENSREDLIKTYEKNAEAAKNSYKSAKENLTVTLAAQDAEIRALQSNVEQARASGDNSVNSVDLKNLYEELEKTIIKSPISGTITKMDMVKGQVPTASVAQVETVERTVVESQVKEYDFPSLKIGMDVEVTSDALGRAKVFKGKIESIDPTPIEPKTMEGQNQGVVYKTKISIEDSEKKLQPGMTARIKYVKESKKDVIVVPTTSIYKKADKNFMLVVEDKEIATIKEVEVRVITGNDIETVIQSDQLSGKLRAINSADKYQSGTEVKLVDENIEEDQK